MQALIRHNLLNIVRTLVLALFVGQSALLVHELEHGPHPGETDCEICLHIPSGSSANETVLTARVAIAHSQIAAPLTQQLTRQTPRYTQPSRGPPLV